MSNDRTEMKQQQEAMVSQWLMDRQEATGGTPPTIGLYLTTDNAWYSAEIGRSQQVSSVRDIYAAICNAQKSDPATLAEPRRPGETLDDVISSIAANSLYGLVLKGPPWTDRETDVAAAVAFHQLEIVAAGERIPLDAITAFWLSMWTEGGEFVCDPMIFLRDEAMPEYASVRDGAHRMIALSGLLRH